MKSNQTLLILSNSTNPVGANSIFNYCAQNSIDSRLIDLDDPSLISILNSDLPKKLICRMNPSSYYKYKKLSSAINNLNAKSVINATLRAFNKVDSAGILTENKIPVPETHVISNINESALLAAPLVLKPSVGNQGKGVVLAQTTAQIVSYSKELLYTNENFLAQEYIEESKGSDKRLFVVGDKVVAAMKRVAKSGDFRANIHLGAHAEKYKPTDEEVLLACKATRVHQLSFAGVDIIDSNKGPLVLEVNPSPGFGISIISGIDVVSKVVEFLMKEKE